MSRTCVAVLSIVGFLPCGALLARAQECEWLFDLPQPPYPNFLYAMTTWDPDGPGPDPASLIIGGEFDTVGGITVNNIAAWNGDVIEPLGSGVSDEDDAMVYALTVYNGELIAGGQFTIAGGVECNRIARFSAEGGWQPLGSGMSGGDYHYVCALTVYNAELIAGGSFTTAGGEPCSYIAAWDGNVWHPLGSGMGASTAYVRALTVYNGELIAGGAFTTAGGAACNRIARWDGSAWQALGSGTDAPVFSLGSYNDELIVGGCFTMAGGEYCSRIARWSLQGGWHPLGAGVLITHGPSQLWTRVSALKTYRGELIVGGWFTKAGDVEANNIAAWDGSVWHALGSGVGAPTYAEAVFHGDLIAGGVNGWGRWHCSSAPGDLNCDGAVNFGDINPFVLALSNPAVYQQALPDCDIMAGDINVDGTVNFADINPFVGLLTR